jgi:diguanylate cyclase (GGDEF)-like protein
MCSSSAPSDPASCVAGDLAREHEALIEFLYTAPIGLIQTAADGEIAMINPLATQLLMPLARDGDLSNLLTVLDTALPALRGLVAAFDAPSGVVCQELRFGLESASPGEVDRRILSISVTKLDSDRLIARLGDVTAEVQREKRGLDRHMRNAARRDGLTALPNRVSLVESIDSAISTSIGDPGGTERREFAVLFLNCDRFKQINDLLGHAVGDTVLRLVGERLMATLRTQDRVGLAHGRASVAARIGGDEFVILLEGLAQADDVHAVAQRVLDALAQPFGIGSEQVRCSASMGVVLRAQSLGNADDMLRDASIAMVAAKRDGGARYAVFEPFMRIRAAQRAEIESDLRRGLGEGEFFVVYQPVLGLQADPTGRARNTLGVEALVRWRHPRRGLVPPLEFIGVAEECGLIDELSHLVLDTACRQFMDWESRLGDGAPGQLAVNLSRAQLRNAACVDAVRTTLRRHGMEPARLQLEVTESLAAQDATVSARLRELKTLGLSLALDDFGTGYSSLSSLHALPVDTVKIDRSFISLVDSSPHHRVLVEATVRVAKSLGMNTVAEGIETPAQAAMVVALGCDKGQGYLFSHPLTADALTAWAGARRDTEMATESGSRGPSVRQHADTPSAWAGTQP